MQDKTIQRKQDILKQRKKIIPANKGRICKDIPRTGFKRQKTNFEQNMGTNK